jgi:hypothetical protein
MVVPGLPQRVTQRGNRREAIFFEDGDQRIYPFDLGAACSGRPEPGHRIRPYPGIASTHPSGLAIEKGERGGYPTRPVDRAMVGAWFDD